MSTFTELDSAIKKGDVDALADLLDRNGLHCTVEDSDVVLKAVIIEEYGDVFYDPEYGPTWRVEQVGDTAIEEDKLMADLIKLIDENRK